METATAAAGSARRKLQSYLSNRDADHRGDVERLGQELASIHAALLLRAAQALPPPGQLRDEEPAGAWAGEARELAYDVEDAVDGLLVTPSPPPPPSPGFPSHPIKGLLQRAAELSRSRPQFPDVPKAPAVVDRHREQQLPPDGEAAVVGVDDARDRLVRRLRLRDEAGDGDDPVQVVSVVGSPGLGKTTLAGAAYGVLKPRFDCAAFVSFGLDPNVLEVLESALWQLDVDKESDAGAPRDEELLISELRRFLQNKRYFIVLDDLWERSSWEKIRCALPDNNFGSRIVTTTCNLDFAGEVGETYELKPLSSESSKKLFFRTIFGSEEKCPDDEFTEVAYKILEKSGGVPLAIITLAKLLASNVRDKSEWQKVCKSIGPRLENTPDVKKMRMAVSTGYYNLPPHLRACLLYMSIFPENCEIRRDRLIWWWIAEGFIQAGEQYESLFQLGESYYDDLVNRSMIMPLDIDYSDDGGPYEPCCRVSFPVMDFISCLSSQENFVAVLEGEQRALPSEVPVRRVSVRGGRAEDSASLGTMSVPQLRSLSVFSPATAETIDLNRFGLLRVLDLEGCDLSESHLLQKHLGSLIHLRYLGLRETRIVSVPEEIGNLKFLQTLDLDENLRVNELPASVTELRELMCLRVYWQTRLPSGIAKLTALEELSDATTRDSPELVKELGKLTKLRTLRITLCNPSRCEEEALVESLRGLRKLQTLDVYVAGGDGKEKKLDAVREAWVPPPCLREFRARSMNTAWSPLRQLPSWLLADAAAAAAVPRLAVLVIQVAELRQRDVDALGRLPALRVLRLEPDATAEALHVAGGAFPRLTELRLRDADVAPVFRPGAMPRLRRLEVCFRVRNTVDLGNGGFEFGFENLACLEEATVYVGCQEAWETETEMAEKALQRAADGHPNRANFDVITFGEELMCFDD